MADQEQDIRHILQDLSAKLHALPTRDELERIFSRFITKEVFDIEMKNIRRDIDGKANIGDMKNIEEDVRKLKSSPENIRSRILWIITVGGGIIAIIAIFAQHLAWK